MGDKLKELFRVGKIILTIILGIVGLAIWLAYKMSVVIGVQGYKN
jgi:hypothetical protein